MDHMVTKTIKKLISREDKLAQGAFGLKSKMIYRNSKAILEKLLPKSILADERVRAEFKIMADKIESLELEIANLKRSKKDNKRVKGMVGKNEKVVQSGLKEKLEGSK